MHADLPSPASVSSASQSLWARLINPPATVPPEEARRVRLLSAILLVLCVAAILGATYAFIDALNAGSYANDFAPYLVIYGVAGIVFVAYALTRTRYFAFAVWLTILLTLIDIPIVFLVLYYRTATLVTNNALLAFLAIPVIVASIFLSARQTFWVGVAALLAVLSIPLLLPVYPATFISFSLVFVGMAIALLVVASSLREDYINRIRHQVEKLTQTEAQLQESNQTLEQRVAERTKDLERSQARYRSLVELNPDLIFTLDPNNIITFTNARPEFDPRLRGRSIYEVTPPYQHDAVTEAIAETIRTNTVQTYEMQGINPDGLVQWWNNRVVPISEDGKYTGLTIISTDITARRESELALLLRNSAIESSSTGITIADATQPDTPLIYVNKAFTEVTGYSEEEALGRNCRFLQNDDRDQPGVQRIREALREGHGCDVEVRNYRKDGTLFWNELRLAPIHDAEGNLTHYVGLSTDITAKKTLEAEREKLVRDLEATVGELKIAKRIADENSRLKSEFLATMSHELRTPLNAIEGYSSIMLNNMGVEMAAAPLRMVERIGANSKRLLNLINDFLDLSRIEAGRFDLAHAPIKVKALAESWLGEVQVLAEQKGLRLTAEIDPALPSVLRGDADALTKLAVNLLGNAVKFTQEGEVTLHLKRLNPEAWAIVVSDTGIGVAPHAREYIFEEFRQVDSSSKREYSGTGLGLSIVQKLARLMGGNVTLMSEVGQGSTFTVTLPLAYEKTAALA